MVKVPSIDRRSLLLGAAPMATAVISGLAGCSPRSGDAAPAYSPTFFSADEWAFVRAAVGRLIRSEGPGPGGIEAGVPEFIDRQLEMPYGHGAYFYLIGPFQTDVPPSLGYQLRYNPREIYRLGIAAANGEARKAQGKTFAELPADAQDGFLHGMDKNGIQLATAPAPVFFTQLLAHTNEGYFADPLYGGRHRKAAWKRIGFPRPRADLPYSVDHACRPLSYSPNPRQR